jgi:hypothetical protein
VILGEHVYNDCRNQEAEVLNFASFLAMQKNEVLVEALRERALLSFQRSRAFSPSYADRAA